MKKLTSLGILFYTVIIIFSFTFFSCTNGLVSTTETALPFQPDEVKWNLSGDVMPEPGYGSIDIPNSDIASNLTIYQTDKQVQITGEMDGLRSDRLYQVLLAKGYVPDTEYPGLFADKTVDFTFKSDQDGAYRWTFVILDSDFSGSGTYTLSIWISDTAENQSVLVSDNFDITID